MVVIFFFWGGGVLAQSLVHMVLVYGELLDRAGRLCLPHSL